MISKNADMKRAMASQNAVCPACGSDDMRPLPELANRSMISDGRIVPVAFAPLCLLRLRACRAYRSAFRRNDADVLCRRL